MLWKQRHRSKKIQDHKSFPIVGILASAGGLEGFTELLSHLPINTGMAFVLIQHLAPNQKSLLTEILTKTTDMPVSEVYNNLPVEPNHVYVIPPNTSMTLAHGVLQLISREKINKKYYMPGDSFFISLASAIGNKAISVVLSGSNADGTEGTEAIKAVGGITFAQSEESAQFSEMPNSAIATGDVDFILSPSEIGEELAKIATRPNLAQIIQSETSRVSVENKNVFSAIFDLLYTATDVDFTHYKQNTLKRRIARRMVSFKLKNLKDYLKYLENNPNEILTLYQEILISVTSFFRDPEAYQALKEIVFPSIIKGKSVDSPIRIWIAGCSSGEEVYSIAISLLEFLEQETSQPTIQIFATDINETVIEKARLGIYKPNQMAGVSPERQKRFFNQVEGGYQISKSIRQLCVFARQNLISDPPFSNLDLVSCRNVLIYLGAILQKRLMPILHYSLQPNGFLILGIAESVGEFSNLFSLIDKKHSIYSRNIISTPLHFDFATTKYTHTKISSYKPIVSKNWDVIDLNKQADQIILNRYAPVGVMVNDNMDILQFRGETSPYLRPSPGEPSFNLFKMAHKGLLEELRFAIYQAKKESTSVRKEQILIEEITPAKKVNIEVIPFQSDSIETECCLVLFEDVPIPLNPSELPTPENVEVAGTETGIVELQKKLRAAKQELTATQEYLELMTQENETTTHSLKMANEEILSNNEELQSTNEELQTAKEELQATNEELNTTNQELHSRNLELHQVNNDLVNLLSSINIPILILANDLAIRRFTPTAQSLFNLISTDIGRPFSDIRSTINVDNIDLLIREVIDTLTIKELEVQDQGGRWYNLRIRPYKTIENQINGVVIVLLDIDAIKRTTKQLQEAFNYVEAILQNVPEPLLVLNSDLQVIKSNPAFYQMFQISSSQAEHNLIFELVNGQWNIPELKSLLAATLLHDIQIQNFEVEKDFDKIGFKTILINANKIVQEGNQQMILLGFHDITQQKQFEIERGQLLAQEQSARQEAEASNRVKDEFLSILSHELRNPLHAILGWFQLLQGQKLDETKKILAIDTIHRSAKAQTQMIEDLLDLSRITTGKLQLHNLPVDLNSVINTSINIVRLSAEAKNIQIESQLQPAIGQVVGDADRLQQVIWNLLSNAIKFTTVGGCVTIKVEYLNSQAEIRVSDTGIGIPSEFLPYIFERFRQVDSSKTRIYNGLGLGLSLVRYVVELHGGTVHAESPGEGLGTTIIVRLPLNFHHDEHSLQNDLSVNDFSDPPKLVDEQTIPSLQGLSVLVVDDEPDMRELMMTVLQNSGAEVTTVSSTQEAISILTSQPRRYDVLLSDIGMSNQDGYDLIRQVRQLSPEAGGQIPAAAMTGYTSNADIQESRLAGFQMHIAKPIEPNQLISVVFNLAHPDQI